MTYVVAILQEVWPDHLEALLGTIRQSFVSAPTAQPGRRASRLFQRLGQPTQLLSLTEWTDEPAFEQFAQWPVFLESSAASGPPPRIEPLVSLRRFERMEQRAALASCAWVTAPPEATAEVRDFLLHEAHERVRAMGGLVSREVYQSRLAASRFLSVLTWRSMADLERFRAVKALDLDEANRRLGATVERFTGAVAAELSVLGIADGSIISAV